MADIHVQTKKQPGGITWIWIVVVLLIAAAVVYYIVTRNNPPSQEHQTTPATPTSFLSGRPPAFHSLPAA